MAEALCTDMFAKKLVSRTFSWWVSYDYKSLEACPGYDGPLALDFYGRVHPRHSNGTVRLSAPTNSALTAVPPLLLQFDEKTDRRLLYRRLGVCANEVARDESAYQLDLFTDYEAIERDRKMQGAMLEVRKRVGANAVFKGADLLEGATTLERNMQIGGHRA
jgi:DNA polymerase V